MPTPAHLLHPRVLIVEDEIRLRELLMDMVPEMGFTARATRSAEEAIKLMQEDPADIVLLDLQLPLMGGMDFFTQLRQQWPVTQVIIMTGFGDLESARRAIRLDVVDFLTKPFHLRDVDEALDRARKRIAQNQPDPKVAAETDPKTLAEVQRQTILSALDRHAGNRTAAAQELGISRRKLHYWLSENADD